MEQRQNSRNDNKSRESIKQTIWMRKKKSTKYTIKLNTLQLAQFGMYFIAFYFNILICSVLFELECSI